MHVLNNICRTYFIGTLSSLCSGTEHPKSFGHQWGVSLTCNECRRILLANDSRVAKIALHVYETRDLEGSPILADALEEAECKNQGLLDFCRNRRSLLYVQNADLNPSPGILSVPAE